MKQKHDIRKARLWWLLAIAALLGIVVALITEGFKAKGF